jgi:hypothetical protein
MLHLRHPRDSFPREPPDGSNPVAEIRRWLGLTGNSSDSLAEDIYLPDRHSRLHRLIVTGDLRCPVRLKVARKLTVIVGLARLVWTSGRESVQIKVAISAVGRSCVTSDGAVGEEVLDGVPHSDAGHGGSPSRSRFLR